jgi:type I restriction enzyme, S subunit
LTTAASVSIGELERQGAITELQDGNHGASHPKSEDYVEDGVPFVMCRNISDGVLHLDTCEHLTQSQAQRLRVGFAKTGDVLLSHKGTLGLTARVPSVDPYVVLTPQVTYYRTNSALLDPEYLKYVFRDPSVLAQMQAIGNQSTRPFVSITAQRNLNIWVWPPATQRKIAAILSAYDELIENNNRRIKILEEMARRIYYEWFIDLRYPGAAGVPLADSELGPIPLDWSIVRLGDRFNVVLGGTPSRSIGRYWEGGTVPWINSGRVNDLRVIAPSELITQEALERSNAKLMPRGTTLVAITGATLGQVSLLEIAACANQSVVGIYGSDDSLTEYLYLTIQQSIGRIIGAASGGAQQHINQKIVSDTLIMIPNTDVAQLFRRLINPIFGQIAGLLFVQVTLRSTRDLLLPRLVSGEINVSQLDIGLVEEFA